MTTKIQLYKISSGAIDSSGDASGYSEVIRGKILAVHIDYPAHNCTVDLDSDGEASAQKILDLAAASTDAVYYPRTPVCNNAGTENVYYEGTNKVHTEFSVFGRIKLTVASGTDGEEVDAYLLVEEY